jgi:hypothetical protein
LDQAASIKQLSRNDKATHVLTHSQAIAVTVSISASSLQTVYRRAAAIAQFYYSLHICGIAGQMKSAQPDCNNLPIRQSLHVSTIATSELASSTF